MAEYAVAINIDDDTDFAWWAHYLFKQRDRIIAKCNTKYWRIKNKYGVRLTKTAAEALELDSQTDQPIWENYFKKYMNKE